LNGENYAAKAMPPKPCRRSHAAEAMPPKQGTILPADGRRRRAREKNLPPPAMTGRLGRRPGSADRQAIFISMRLRLDEEKLVRRPRKNLSADLKKTCRRRRFSPRAFYERSFA
jgi:hypothetical protein